ncbi:MAG: hypothetical protein K8L97_28965 [Anaerolineae bacterium]|nr:hypothetical protein [Anaerolineae bacterium]
MQSVKITSPAIETTGNLAWFRLLLSVVIPVTAIIAVAIVMVHASRVIAVEGCAGMSGWMQWRQPHITSITVRPCYW